VVPVDGWGGLDWGPKLFERGKVWPEEKRDAVTVLCDREDQRREKMEVRAAKVGRATTVGRENIGRLKVVTRGA